MIEKLETCPVCGAALDQREYDLQTHGNHWITLLPILFDHIPSEPADEEREVRELRATKKNMAAGIAAGIAAIRAERQRQIEVEGWSAEHDDAHDWGQLLMAARVYFYHAQLKTGESLALHRDGTPVGWPWDAKWWKPKTTRRDLERAGALCMAEIERVRRLSRPSGAGAAESLLRRIEHVLGNWLSPQP